MRSIATTLRRREWPWTWRFVLLVLAGTILAVLIRISLLPFKSGDFLTFDRVWYYHIQTHGFAGFRRDFSNYNLPWLYLLYVVARFGPGIPNLVAIKLPSLVADFVCAGIAYRIVALQPRSRGASFLAYMAILLAPTVLLNGSFWGQTDMIYTATLAASMYGLLTRKPWVTTTFFAVGLAFKLQALFLLPFLLALSLRGELGWKHWIAVPAALVLAALPAWLVGRPASSLAAVYLDQTGNFMTLSLFAPTLYAWFPSPPELYQLFLPAGLIFSFTIAAIFVVLVAHSEVELTNELRVQLAAMCLILVPFVTPKMHERYYFAADILTIILAFYRPSLVYVAAIVNMSSFFSYIVALFGSTYHVDPVPQPWLALAMLFALGGLMWTTWKQLYPGIAGRPEPG